MIYGICQICDTRLDGSDQEAIAALYATHHEQAHASAPMLLTYYNDSPPPPPPSPPPQPGDIVTQADGSYAIVTSTDAATGTITLAPLPPSTTAPAASVTAT